MYQISNNMVTIQDYSWYKRDILNHKIYHFIYDSQCICIQEYPDKSASWWMLGQQAKHSRSLESAAYNALNFIGVNK